MTVGKVSLSPVAYVTLSIGMPLSIGVHVPVADDANAEGWRA